MRTPQTAAAATQRSLEPSAMARALPRGSRYAQLSREIRQAGLLERRRGWYALRIAMTVTALAAGWVGFVLVGDSWWQLAVAAFLAIAFTQIAFLGHDAGHQQISGSRRQSRILGLFLGNLVIGLSFGWWVSKHNRHHSNPNTEGADPDIAIGALAFTSGQAASSRGLVKILFRYQAYLFFPLLLGEAISLHAASIRSVATSSAPHRRVEAAMLVIHVAAYVAAVFLVLSPVKAVTFILVNQGLFGLYLGISFAPNHKGMPIFDSAEKVDFLRRQVLTSRNVDGGWLIDLALGGLNYQIEHHLFPSMPRPNLRRAQPLIRDFCARHELPYCQTSMLTSYLQALRHLDAVGRSIARAAAAG